jgi:uncharacterized protein YdhG (YjbR/CyaY superfamily)
MPTPITDYILQFPADVQQKLNELRTAILEIVPDATEKIAYGIPTFYVNGNLVHFAAYKSHIGFYPASSGIDAFREELAPYKLSRGTVQFPLDKPLPMELIRRIVQYRLAENLAK